MTTSLRARKKAESRQKMLDAAKQLFIERGYSKTTMEEIAEQAGFGVATLYIYFKSKEGMFAAMARDDMSQLEKAGEQALTRLPDDPVEAVYTLLREYNRVYEFVSYAVVEEFIAQSKSNGPLRDISRWVLGWQLDQLDRALRACQAKGTVSASLDTALAADIVKDLLLRHNQRVASAVEDAEDLRRLKKKIGLLLEGWSAKAARG